MSGKVSGVTKLIHDRYIKALYFHCAIHRLNLVINDLNKIIVILLTESEIWYSLWQKKDCQSMDIIPRLNRT
jgi:hypothetical protein